VSRVGFLLLLQEVIIWVFRCTVVVTVHHNSSYLLAIGYLIEIPIVTELGVVLNTTHIALSA
jgi:hypothetical protein